MNLTLETLISIDFFFSNFKWVTAWKPSVKVGGNDSYWYTKDKEYFNDKMKELFKIFFEF